jgi:tRNA(adenine34) deaminase
MGSRGRVLLATEDQAQRDAALMRLALDEARLALDTDDVPVGAVVVDAEGNVLGRGHNRREERGDPCAHAEIEALRDAARERGLWRLDGTVLYATLEPCAMCAGALVNARVDAVVFGAWDQRAGAVESLFRICDDARLNHRLQVRGGVLEPECRALLQDFFRAKRARKKDA